MAMTLDGSLGVTFNDASLQGAAASPYVLKNRIINGAMVIDQRNAGASVTASNTGNFSLDRWQLYSSTTGKFTAQQNAASVTPPVGFTNYAGCTSTSAYSITSTDQMLFQQKIEGYNVADLGWGTANAKTVTLSFWVRSSLTGTFGGSLQNDAQNRCFPFSYTISAANTWEYKTITIPGDTTGTWLTTTGLGISVAFSLGTGATYSGTAGAWTGTSFITSVTGAVSVVGTSGATWYVTGVQLEQNTSATPFERRLFNQEVANCQRYFSKTFDLGIAPAAATGQLGAMFSVCGAGTASTQAYIATWKYPVTMRTTPSITTYSTNTTGGSGWYDSGGGAIAAAVAGIGESAATPYNTGTATSPRNAAIQLTASAEL